MHQLFLQDIRKVSFYQKAHPKLDDWRSDAFRLHLQAVNFNNRYWQLAVIRMLQS